MLAHPLRHGRVQLERDGGARDRHGHLRLVEDAREPPHARAAAVLVVRLGAGVALRRLHARVGVLAPAVVAVVAPGHRVLRARLVDEHEVDDDARVAGPREARRRAAVADEVARADGGGDQVGGIHGTSRCGPPSRTPRAWRPRTARPALRPRWRCSAPARRAARPAARRARRDRRAPARRRRSARPCGRRRSARRRPASTACSRP